MNYIKELNAFYDRLETNTLSPSAVSLWHALMHVNNKAGWIKEFTVSISVLSSKSGLSERTVTRARSELQETGYIQFKTRQGKQSAIYQMRELSVIMTGKLSDNLSRNRTGKVSGNGSALVKENDTKTKDRIQDHLFNTLHAQFEKNFGTHPTPIQIDILQIFMKKFGLEPDLVLHALELSGERGKPFVYAKKILTNWQKQKIKTMEQMKQGSKRNKQNVARFPAKKGGPLNEKTSLTDDTSPQVPSDFKFYK